MSGLNEGGEEVGKIDHDARVVERESQRNLDGGKNEY